MIPWSTDIFLTCITAVLDIKCIHKNNPQRSKKSKVNSWGLVVSWTIKIQAYNKYYYSQFLHHILSYSSEGLISVVKPTRCTNVSNLFYFGKTLYMFQTVFPSIIGSLRLYIQQYLFDKCLLLYVQSQMPYDGRKDRPKHVECHSKIK